MKPKVLITKPIPNQVERYLSEYCDYQLMDIRRLEDQEELLKNVREIEGLMTSSEVKIDSDFLNSASRLRIVSNIAVGYNNFDLAAMKQRKIMGTNTPDVLNETVADLVFGLILSAARRIPELDRMVKDGKWENKSDEYLFGVDVHHMTLGIIGMGRIGEAIARRAKFGFNMNVLYYNRSRKTEAEQKIMVEYSQFEELIRKSDYIVLMTPLTKETINLIGAKEFDLMKESAIFINPSRGQTVDEEALIKALQEGKIRAAGVDVYNREPIQENNPLLRLPNVVTLPHIGSATMKCRYEMVMVAAKNLVQGLKGMEPDNIVTELKGYC